jgi:glycosyltransferase involved in cell wall biosynthesis
MAAASDLIICGHIAQLPVAWLASLFIPNLRYTLVAHGLEVWRPFTWLERRALQGAWRILCVSDYTRREILSRIPLAPERVIVVPNALDPALEAPAAVPRSGPPVILTVSRLASADRYKGIDHLIEAMPAILSTTPSVTLRIVGRGDDRPRLEQLARDRGVTASVEFTGYVNDDQLRDEFAGCTIFALPSQKEGFGLVYMEAMIHGKPCIAAQAGGAPEVITPGSGLLVPYADVPALATACTTALSKPWDTPLIRACAQRFSYQEFRHRLEYLLTA